MGLILNNLHISICRESKHTEANIENGILNIFSNVDIKLNVVYSTYKISSVIFESLLMIAK